MCKLIIYLYYQSCVTYKVNIKDIHISNIKCLYFVIMSNEITLPVRQI